MSKLSRENYERFVSILANHCATDELARAVADYFKEDNDKFDADKFIKAFLSQVSVHRKLHKVHNKLKQYKNYVDEVKCTKCRKTLDTVKRNYTTSNGLPYCTKCAKELIAIDYRTQYFRGRGS
jgi:predicted SprT family Zn-dependent metalloprotease